MGMPDLLGDWLICGVIMSRKNKKARWRECHWTGTEQLHTIPLDKPKKKALSRCAYCGRLLGVSGWHWMVDEFGQRVRKCNDERNCKRKRKDAAEEAYEAAVRRSQKI